MFGSSSLFAIDIGEYSVKVLDIKWSQTADLEKYAASYDITTSQVQDETVVDDSDPLNNSDSGFALGQALKSMKVKNAKVLTSIPLSDAIMREISIEHANSDHEIEGAIGVELGETLPFTLDQVYFDFLPKSNSGEQNHFLVAASRKESIDEKTWVIKDVLKKGQLSEIQVDVDAYAYDRLVSKIYEPTLRNNKIILLVDIGHKRSKFYFYGSEGLVYNREQQIGGFQATEAVAEVFDLSTSEAEQKKHSDYSDGNFQELITAPFAVTFSEQLNLVLDFYDAARKNDKEIDRIVFCGGGSCLSGFLNKLSDFIEHRVEMLDLNTLTSKKMNISENYSFAANYALCSALLVDGVIL